METALVAEMDLTPGDIREKVIAEVAAREAQNRLQPGEFTVSQYAEQNSITHQQAKGELERAVEAGTVERKVDKILLDGNWQWAYSQKSSEP